MNHVVTAFQYGASVLERARQHRASQGAAPLPSWLEESITEAPDEIEREKKRGVKQFGKQYEVGDDEAVKALQHITIQLQCSLMMKINTIADSSTDFKALARAADEARDGTITALMNLRKRLQQAEMETDLSSLRISTELPPPPPVITEAREMTMSPASQMENTASLRRDSVPFHRNGPDFARNSLPAQRASYGSRHDTLSPTSSVSSDQRRKSTMDSIPLETQHTHISYVPELGCSLSILSTQPHVGHNMPSSQLAALPKPDRKNNYLGFCKCAWKLQGGDEKAFVKAKDWTQRTASSTAYSLACDRWSCEFKSPYKSAGNPNVIWNRLVVDDENGLKFRWSFLAESHVQQKNVVNEDYSYQCQFCVFMGLKVPVMNLAMLLEHISSEHRKHQMSDVILDRTSCVSDRICRDGEKFDINLYPVIHGVEADAFISPVLGDMRDPLMRPVEPVEKYSEIVQSVYELHG